MFVAVLIGGACVELGHDVVPFLFTRAGCLCACYCVGTEVVRALVRGHCPRPADRFAAGKGERKLVAASRERTGVRNHSGTRPARISNWFRSAG